MVLNGYIMFCDWTCFMSQSFDRPSGRSATTPSGTDSADGSGALGAWTSTYRVPKMDCPSEERMIRLALSGFEEVRTLAFDLSNRRLEVVHHGLSLIHI